MPDTSLLSPFVVKLGGGLVLDKDAFTLPFGAATQLQNFEPDINGGYRRINGFTKFNSNIVPQTSASTEKVLGVHIYKDQVIAARGTKVFKGGASGSWTEIDTGRTSAGRYNFVNINFDGTDKVIYVDGANLASVFNNSSVADVSASGRPADPQFVEVFRSHVFYAGMSSSPQELIFSVPFDEDNFTSGSGAGSIKVDGIIKGIKVFRENLFVFCEDSIFKITGSSLSDFAVVPVTRKIGCVDGFSIQEISGDIVYLAPDGLRTIAGTERIGDVELGTVSKQIQPRLDSVNTDRISSVVIRSKTQYRLFFPDDDASAALQAKSPGIIGVIKAGTEGGIGWEYADISGVRPTSAASGFISGVETILHGGYDGYIHKQETGNTFDGTNINAIYRSPDYIMGDPGIRKLMQRIIWNYDNEGAVSSKFRIRYDFNSSDVPQPAEYDLTSGAAIALYGLAASTYGTAVYGSSGTPLVRQSVEGGGFTVAVRLDDTQGAAPISVKGYQLEFTPGGRR
tara:strand:- start:1271 stop:2803 length:1533 start_codon:yes stop_codon:yes gene_type:complete